MWEQAIPAGIQILGSLFGRRRRRRAQRDQDRQRAEQNARIQPYLNLLQQSYSDPNSVLQGQEYQGIARSASDTLQRTDAAGGRLANDFGRQAELQNLASNWLTNYRQGLQGSINQIRGVNASEAPVRGATQNEFANTLMNLGGQYASSIGGMFGKQGQSSSGMAGGGGAGVGGPNSWLDDWR